MARSPGYELARRFDRSLGYFWSATHQQLYRTLRVVEGDGWVTVMPVVPRRTGGTDAVDHRTTRRVVEVGASGLGRQDPRRRVRRRRLVLRGGIGAEENAIDWLDEVRAAL
jgi:Virulence activator alpha C-term